MNIPWVKLKDIDGDGNIKMRKEICLISTVCYGQMRVSTSLQIYRNYKIESDALRKHSLATQKKFNY